MLVCGITEPNAEVMIQAGKEKKTVKTNHRGEWLIDISSFNDAYGMVKSDKFHGRYHRFVARYKVRSVRVFAKYLKVGIHPDRGYVMIK